MTGPDIVRRRRAAGPTQRQLAAAAGLPQPSLASYESGKRRPSEASARRLESALSVPTLERLRAVRGELIAAATRRRLGQIRVFGSVARGVAGPGSDVDLLVHPAPDASLFDLAGFGAEAEAALGLPVDVVSDRASGPAVERIRQEAVPL
ncbi:MAG: XRE family transcriptional regulator [Bifidobacteriaceae bacterium]|nr:XRE family transcriptional regulator [Bifidobacteriaceae bacterium]